VAGRAGVLALQGAFREHCRALRDVGLDAVEVRVPADLDGVDGLVIPGGESTTMSKLIDVYGLEEPILDLHRRGGALFGTCAGMILLAASAVDGRPDQRSLGLIDLEVRRNAYGRQVSSFEAPVRIAGEDLPMHGIFIRAPRIERMGEGIEAVATLDGDPVAARQGSVMVAAFHPELTTDRRLHARFASMVMRRGVQAA
jgi:pyridoxal 5'-phosphate synthase pdxT subunit